MLSVVYKGKVLDFKYITRETDTVFYIGEIIIGQMFNLDRLGWSAICIGQNPKMRRANGFKTRYAASQFMLESLGYYPNP